MHHRPSGPRPAGRFLLLLALLALVLAGCTTSGTAVTEPSDGPSSQSGQRFASEPPAAWDGGAVSLGELPEEALETLQLIAGGGPFLYDQDGSTFQNREGILPDAPSGYYAEYTVETPGSPDRGARRLVVGDDWYVHWTDDHYDSFRFVTL